MVVTIKRTMTTNGNYNMEKRGCIIHLSWSNIRDYTVTEESFDVVVLHIANFYEAVKV